MMRLFYIAAGGAIGSIFRYALSGFTYRIVDGIFPWGTVVVNLTGCFVIGFLWGIFEETTISSTLRTFIFIGILGGFTTFSTYGFETFQLLRIGEMKLAIQFILIQNVVGLLLVFGGYMLSNYIFSIIK
jgi:fluoride exporter